MVLSLKVLGEFLLNDASGAPLSLPTRKTRALMGYLAVYADQPLQRDRLMALLWGDRGEKQARHSLNHALMAIRKLGQKSAVALLDGDVERVMLRSEAIETDVSDFRRLLVDDPEAATALYRGPFLDGLVIPDPVFEQWLTETRTEFHNTTCDALLRAADNAFGNGDVTQAIQFARRLVTLDPLREEGHRRLMRLLTDSGDRAGALRQYQACAGILRTELQVEPDSTTRALCEEIRKGVISTDIGGAPAPSAPPVQQPLLPVPDKPSIAVLPFTNLNGDPEQDFFGEGLAEDIITELSRFRSLFVIARNSTFAYKNRAIDVKTVAREMGVRYVLEGSVRKIGRRIRVTGQLIDAEAGNHIWAERYDRELDDLFAIQDEITDSIVAAIEPEVSSAERERVMRRPPGRLDAWGLYQKGLAAYYSSTEEGFRTAIDCFDRANAMDPNFALAFAMGAEARCRYIANWNPDESEALLVDAAEKVQRAIGLDPRESMCLAADARVRAWQGRFNLAIEKARQAVTLNPNHALAHHIRGAVLAAAHRPDEALESFDQAIRLSPSSAFMAGFQMVRAASLFQLGRYEDAMKWAQQSVYSANPRVIAFAILAASLSKLDRMDEAKAVLEQLYERQPNFRISRISVGLGRVTGTGFPDALRRVGVPE